ncbi:MAG: hypothetical protein HOE54_10135 [Gammaproteobacteria bacterium]|nr:hypothetical protein [Gammaproteobacteria bacterium]
MAAQAELDAAIEEGATIDAEVTAVESALAALEQGATSGVIEGATSLNLATATGADLRALLVDLKARRDTVITVRNSAETALFLAGEGEQVWYAANDADQGLTLAIAAIEAVIDRTDDDLADQASIVNTVTANAEFLLADLDTKLEDAQADVANNAILNDIVEELTDEADLDNINDAIDDAIASVAGT